MTTYLYGRLAKALLVLGVSVLAIGGVASATNDNDQGSGVRAWAQVDPNGGTPLLVKSQGIASVTSPSTGVYCLHPRPGVNLANSAPVAYAGSQPLIHVGLVTVRRSGIPNVNCPVDDLQVNTWGDFNLTVVNTVGFDVVVP